MGPSSGEGEGPERKESTLEDAPESVTTHLCFFRCFCISSFLCTSFSFFRGAFCSLKEVLPSLFLLPS